LKQDIASLVKACMERREVSQVELAERAGVDRARLNRWINGRGTVTVESLERVLGVLGLRVTEEQGRGSEWRGA
jgi:transcriptional regulator with XRE-family HTH domain